MQLSSEARHWLAAATRTAASELVARRLPGATSSSVALVQSGDARWVLRVLDNARWLAQEPDLAEHEAAALLELKRAGLRGPELVAHAGEDAGFGAPVVLMSFVEGTVELTPGDLDAWLSRLALQLVAIHAHPAHGFAWHFRSWLNRSTLAVPGWANEPALWQRAIDHVHSPAPTTTPVFLHRDYHPSNVLWRSEQVSGVVDWINACRGPADVDIAHCRTNVCSMYGPDAADRFLAAYRAHGGAELDPYWDLESVLEMCLPEPRDYPPWRDFGLGPIDGATLRRRSEARLERAVRRLERADY
jgi:aminoglycoside phosphotransferase (APT) family kinase protein